MCNIYNVVYTSICVRVLFARIVLLPSPVGYIEATEQYTHTHMHTETHASMYKMHITLHTKQKQKKIKIKKFNHRLSFFHWHLNAIFCCSSSYWLDREMNLWWWWPKCMHERIASYELYANRLYNASIRCSIHYTLYSTPCALCIILIWYIIQWFDQFNSSHCAPATFLTREPIDLWINIEMVKWMCNWIARMAQKQKIMPRTRHSSSTIFTKEFFDFIQVVCYSLAGCIWNWNWNVINGNACDRPIRQTDRLRHTLTHKRKNMPFVLWMPFK